MMDDRATFALWAGLIGLTLGVLGAITESALLAVLAGVAAFAAGALSLRLSSHLRDARERASGLEEQAVQLRAELSAERQVHDVSLEPDVAAPGTAAAAAGTLGTDGLSNAADGNGHDIPVALTDPITGLFNEEFFRVTLDARISAARRNLRPVAVVLLQVFNGVRDGQPEPADAGVVADGIRATLREADTACWLASGRFAFVLEDTPENGAVWTVERVRRFLAAEHPEQTMWAGVACYPAHAFDADEILERATQALEAAREWRQDRIEVATSE